MINLIIAKALGLDVPPLLLTRADEDRIKMLFAAVHESGSDAVDGSSTGT